MPSTAKPRKNTSSRSASSRNNRTAKNASGRARSSAPTSRASNGHGTIADKTLHGAGTVAKGTVAAAVGTAVAAFAGRALIASRRRRRVLGVSIPRKRTNMKRVAKQFSSMAGELEKKSLDVSKASGRVKQASEILS